MTKFDWHLDPNALFSLNGDMFELLSYVIDYFAPLL